VNAALHHRAVEISHMRQLMKYGQAQYEEDWKLSLALSVLLAMGSTERLEMMLERCFNRMIAYLENNPEARPFGS
jgi:hypothetical protein